MKSTPEEIQIILKKLMDDYDMEDRSVRERQIRVWRQMKLMWEGTRNVYFDYVAHDWRIYGWDDDTVGDDTDQDYYDKKANVFRAYLESIIAALSETIPPIKCFPDDADNPLDIMTAKAGDKSCLLMDRHNDMQLKWLHGLFIFCTEGMAACHLEKKSNKKYGTYDVNKYEDGVENHRFETCPQCGFNIEDEIIPELTEKVEQERDEFNPGPEDVEVQDVLQNQEMEVCPNCNANIIPAIVEEPLTITRLVGTTKNPKSQIHFGVYGGLQVKIPNYARKQEDCPYLIWNDETNYVNTFEFFEKELKGTKFQELKDKLKESVGPHSNYEEWARLSPQYNGDYPRDVVTVRKVWLRPCTFNKLDEDECELLKKRYPNGVYACFVNDIFASAVNEDLDDVWTILYNPLAENVHFDPLGLLLTSVQELTNDLISLVIQTIEHGIPQTFADPNVLNFPAYRQLSATPGGIYEAKPTSGKTLKDAFHEVKTSALSGEVLPFFQQLQSIGQLVSGANPTLFGGALEGSETASQFSMSRSQALQRLQTTWKTLTTWWKNIHGKAVPMYLECIKEQGDERNVEMRKDGSFFNTFIRKSELEGKIGNVELEANEQLPMTWGQRKDVIMQLLQTNNPQILAVLASPENLPIIRESIGLDQFYVPGEDDRNKQYDEIKELLNSQPIQNPGGVDEMGMVTEPMENPSVEIDPDYDDHAIQFEIVRSWVVSEEGRMAKIDNPEGYKNVLLHGLQHLQLARMEAPQQMEEGAAPGEKVNKDTETPVKDESDVSTV